MVAHKQITNLIDDSVIYFLLDTQLNTLWYRLWYKEKRSIILPYANN